MGDGGGEAVRRLRMWMRDEKGEEAVLRVSGWAAESTAQFLLPAPGSFGIGTPLLPTLFDLSL